MPLPLINLLNFFSAEESIYTIKNIEILESHSTFNYTHFWKIWYDAQNGKRPECAISAMKKILGCKIYCVCWDFINED